MKHYGLEFMIMIINPWLSEYIYLSLILFGYQQYLSIKMFFRVFMIS
jgi:hypothetical protein